MQTIQRIQKLSFPRDERKLVWKLKSFDLPVLLHWRDFAKLPSLDFFTNLQRNVRLGSRPESSAPVMELVVLVTWDVWRISTIHGAFRQKSCFWGSPNGPKGQHLRPKKMIPARAEFSATTHELVWLSSSNTIGGKVQKSKVHNLSAPSAGTKAQFQDRFLRWLLSQCVLDLGVHPRIRDVHPFTPNHRPIWFVDLTPGTSLTTSRTSSSRASSNFGGK